MNERVGAGEDAGEPLAIQLGFEQADVGVAGDASQDRALLASLAEQD